VTQRANSLADELTKASIDDQPQTACDAALRSIENDDEAMKAVESQAGVILSAQDEELLRAELFAQPRPGAGRRKRIYASGSYRSSRRPGRSIKHLNVSYVSSAKLRWQAASQREEQLKKSFDEQQKLAMEMIRKASITTGFRRKCNSFRSIRTISMFASKM